jgi:uncharacterized protein YjbJ (UPF0337 family)
MDKEAIMSKDLFEAKWKLAKGEMKAKWGKLNDDEIEEFGGKYDLLVGKLEEKYADRKERIKKDFDDWIKSL